MKFRNLFASALSFSIISVATPAVTQIGIGNWDYRPAPMTYGQEDQHHGFDECEIVNDNNRSGFGGVGQSNTLYRRSSNEGLVIKCKNFIGEEVQEKVYFGGPQTEGYSGCKITNDDSESNPVNVGLGRMTFHVGPVEIACSSYSNGSRNEVQEPYYNEDNCPDSWHGTNPPDCMKDCNSQEEEQVW